MAQSLVSGDRR